MLPIIQLGPFAIQVPGLALIAGLWIGLLLAEREAVRLKSQPDQIYSLAYTAILGGVIGGRLVYAARFLEAYVADPLGVLSLNPATLDIPGGIALGGLAAFVLMVRSKAPVRTTLDALAPLVATMAIASGVSHLASGDSFGAPVSAPWSIYLWGEYRYPTQLYEIGLAMLTLIIWWWKHTRPANPGRQFFLILSLVFGSTVFLEAFRGDSDLTIAGLRTTQIAGVIGLAVCLGFLLHFGQGAPSAKADVS